MTGLSDIIGKICPYCQTPIKPGESVVFCSACSTLHHRQCWNEGRGCTTFGCNGNPAAEPSDQRDRNIIDIDVNELDSSSTFERNESDMSYYREPEKPFYKKIPIIPALILLLLVGAWVFRWDYKTTQTIDDKSKIVHKVDRWTSNHWYELYGSFGKTIYSGWEVACLKNGETATTGKQVKDIWHRRNRATVIWYIAFAGTLGFIVYRVVKD